MRRLNPLIYALILIFSLSSACSSDQNGQNGGSVSKELMESSASQGMANFLTDLLNILDFYYVKNLGIAPTAIKFKALAKLGQIQTMSVFCDISEDRQTLTCPCLEGGQVVIDTNAPLETFSGTQIHREGTFVATFQGCNVQGCTENCEDFAFTGEATGSFAFDYDRATGDQQATGSIACLNPDEGILATGECGTVKLCPDANYDGGIVPGGEPSGNVSGELTAGDTNIQFNSLDDLIFKSACSECPPPIGNLDGKIYNELFTCVETLTDQISPMTQCVDCNEPGTLRLILQGVGAGGFVNYRVEDPNEPDSPDTRSGQLCGNRFTWIFNNAPEPEQGDRGYTETGTWYFTDPDNYDGFSTYFSLPENPIPFKGSCTLTGRVGANPPNPTNINPCSPDQPVCQ